MENERNSECYIWKCEEKTHFGYLYCRKHQELLPTLAIKDAVWELELSVRARNCILSTQKQTFKDFLLLSDGEMNLIPNLGEKTLEEIREITDELLPFCR